jgi:threonine aldolase
VQTVNLYSDTQTRPTEGMRRAMYEAEVGDEQRKLDPTVTALQERVAELLGHEAALFLPSGTMCNAIAFRLHIRPGGDEVLLDRTAHPRVAEAGGPGSISGAQLTLLDGDGGIFTPEQVREQAHPAGDRYGPRTRLLSVEQTTNMGGGRVWPQETVREVVGVAREHGMRAHLDGARLMNAVVESGVAASDWASQFDTGWLDFSKGLGAPFGACLAASAELIEEAWRYKQMWGGAMRQGGVIAAAGLYALDHHVDRLADDHANARLLADGLAEIPGVELDAARVQTNIVIFEVSDGPGLARALAGAGVEVSSFGPRRVRMVTHLDVDREGCERALTVVREALAPAAA